MFLRNSNGLYNTLMAFDGVGGGGSARAPRLDRGGQTPQGPGGTVENLYSLIYLRIIKGRALYTLKELRVQSGELRDSPEEWLRVLPWEESRVLPEGGGSSARAPRFYRGGQTPQGPGGAKSFRYLKTYSFIHLKMLNSFIYFKMYSLVYLKTFI